MRNIELDTFDPLNDAIADFIDITTDESGTHVSVDLDGGADNFVHVASAYGATDLSEDHLIIVPENPL